MSTPNYDPLFHWVREREAVRLQKDARRPQPWTSDDILHTYRFCNVRREDDRGTVWIRENIREPFAESPSLWFMLCIARQINWPDTLADLIQRGAWPDRFDFHPSHITIALDRRAAAEEKVFTGAYMISAPATKGASKTEYIAEHVLGELWKARARFERWHDVTMQGTHHRLTKFDGWGAFMAYQAIVDMRFTRLLRDAGDVHTWAAAGPGTLRGLNRLHGRALKAPISPAQALKEMRAIYAIIENETGVAMDFSDVPNILCETDKYLRVKLGEGKPRALYVAGRGS